MNSNIYKKGNPKPLKKMQFSLHMQTSIQLKELAKKTGRSMSDMVEDAIIYYHNLEAVEQTAVTSPAPTP